MRTVIIIPARYDSQRLPGKPLVDIRGKSMIQRVAEQATKSRLANDVWVATDDERVADAAHGFQVVMTDPNWATGTDRCSAAARELGLAPFDIVINVQGDMPYVPSTLIDELIHFTKNSVYAMTTPGIVRKAAVPGMVHILMGNSNQAILFSRKRFEHQSRLIHHVGMYGFRNRVLQEFSLLRPCDLERGEKLEQLRAIYYGIPIGVVLTHLECGPEVNTKEDLACLT